MNQKSKDRGRQKNAESVVDSVHVALDEALQSFHAFARPPLWMLSAIRRHPKTAKQAELCHS